MTSRRNGFCSVKIGPTFIEDTFAEAFGMWFTRLVVTAHDSHWLDAAIQAFCGYGTSVIACDAETGLEQRLSADSTPDGRPGASLLAFGMSTERLARAVANRTGQCLMTCPTTAVYNGLDGALQRLPLGRQIRFFGDGFQKSKLVDGTRYWRIPVMDGEFLVVESLGAAQGVAGGNILLQSASGPAGLTAIRRATSAAESLPGVIMPFPGGVARSGSKVGSRYKKLKASTADAYCPTLRGRVESRLHAEAHCVYEIVIDGVDEPSVRRAMRAAIEAAAGPEVLAIAAGNYGGRLGKYHLRLREILNSTS